MWWNKIVTWFTEYSERNKFINEFNSAAKTAFITNTVPVYLKAETSRGNRAYKHAFSNFFSSGFRIRTLTGRHLSHDEIAALGMLVDNYGAKIRDWRLTTLLELQ